jgi:hypothetical protein
MVLAKLLSEKDNAGANILFQVHFVEELRNEVMINAQQNKKCFNEGCIFSTKQERPMFLHLHGK